MQGRNKDRSIVKIEYDKPIEVTEKQYRYMIEEFKGIIAHRIDEQNKYWIKVWYMKYAKQIENHLFPSQSKTII
jgi:hypothetical protein